MPKPGDWRLVSLTAANVKPKNNHIYLSSCLDFFPADSVGGTNERDSGVALSVKFCPGPFVQTDIAGDKKFLRARSEVGEFFRLTKAAKDQQVRITYIGPRAYVFEIEHPTT